MAVVEKNIEINAPVEKIFNYLQDAETNVEWMPGMVEVKDINIKEGNIGSQFRWTYKMSGLRFEGESEVTENIPNKKIVTQSHGGIQSTWTFSFDAQAKGSALALKVEYKIPIPVLGKFAEKLVLKQNDREATLSLENIKALMEA